MHGVDAVVEALKEYEPLSIVSLLWENFFYLPTTRRGANKTYKNVGSRFCASVSSYASLATSTGLPNSDFALMHLHNVNSLDSQLVPLLFAAAYSASHGTESKSNDDLTEVATYKFVASVILQFDQNSLSLIQVENVNRFTLSPNAVFFTPRWLQYKKYNSYARQAKNYAISSEQLRDFKIKSACTKCSKYGHWAIDHLGDGTVRDDLQSGDGPLVNQTNFSSPLQSRRNEPRSTNDRGNAVMQFNTVSAVSEENDERHVLSVLLTKSCSNTAFGPMVEGGAPYSAIGVVEPSLICSSPDQRSPSNLDPLPPPVSHLKWWQYGARQHSSPRRNILASVTVSCLIDSGQVINICHLVVDDPNNELMVKTLHANVIVCTSAIIAFSYLWFVDNWTIFIWSATRHTASSRLIEWHHSQRV